MYKFLVRRIAFGIVIIILGSFITYAVMRMIPTSFVESMARYLSQLPNSKPYAEWLEQLNHLYGMDRNIIMGFLNWGSFAIRGQFGDSWAFTMPVMEKFSQVIGYSIIISIFTLIAELAISIPLGITAARKQYSKTDYGVTVFALMSISLPSFFFASLMRYAFAVKLNWFDLYGIVGRNHMMLGFWGRVGDIAWHMVLPVATLMMMSIGGLMRYTRTNMLEVLNADYVRTARAKGLPERRVINSHAFRNTLIPLVSYFSYLLPSLFGGAMITEQIFAIPGIGFTAFDALTRGDIPFTMFYMTFMLILTQVSLILADIMYAVVDPRVRIN